MADAQPNGGIRMNYRTSRAITVGLLASTALATPALGVLSDRWGRRPVLIFRLLGSVVSFAMLAVAHSLVVLFTARIIDGLSGGNITTARAYIADVTEPHERARAFGMLGAAFGLGFIVGPGLAGVFAHISYTVGRSGSPMGHSRASRSQPPRSAAAR